MVEYWFALTEKKLSKKKSLSNIQTHYDLSNDFYKLFLDQSMTYSSALFENRDYSLEEAQVHKINRILDLAEVKTGDAILEIGSGGGSLAIEAAKEGVPSKQLRSLKSNMILLIIRFSSLVSLIILRFVCKTIEMNPVSTMLLFLVK